MQTAYTYRENVLTSQKSEKNARRGYRFLYNGMEKDDEVYGDYNSYDFGARLYDPRLGRWLAVDPLAMKYPSFSPYNFVANSPILLIDPDGRSIIISGMGQGNDITYAPNMTIPENATEYQKQTIMSLNYVYANANYKDGDDTHNKVEVLVNSNFEYRIRQSSTGTDFSPYGGEEGGMIMYNINVSNVFEGGNIHSPVDGFAHELDHAWMNESLIIEALQTGDNTKLLAWQLAYPGTDISREEEQRATDGLEKEVAQSLGHHVRSSYSSSPVQYYYTENAISGEPSTSSPTDKIKQYIESKNRSVKPPKTDE